MFIDHSYQSLFIDSFLPTLFLPTTKLSKNINHYYQPLIPNHEAIINHSQPISPTTIRLGGLTTALPRFAIPGRGKSSTTGTAQPGTAEKIWISTCIDWYRSRLNPHFFSLKIDIWGLFNIPFSGNCPWANHMWFFSLHWLTVALDAVLDGTGGTMPDVMARLPTAISSLVVDSITQLIHILDKFLLGQLFLPTTAYYTTILP